jgi:hypothetical protein
MLAPVASLHSKIALVGLTIAFLLAVFPFLLFEILRVFYATPIDANEGFMVIHTNRLLAGQPLYTMPHQHTLQTPLSEFVLIPVNYPPLSFFVVGGLSYLTGSVLFTGRLVSLLSFLCIAALIYGIISNFSSKRSAALLGALLWIALMVQTAGHYVGMYDPQMLGHVFSLGSLYLYSKWTDELTTKKVSMLALLCCLALFIKHLLIAIPITLAITLLFTNRRAFIAFAFSGICIFTALIAGAWFYGGGEFVSSFSELLDRPVSIERMDRMIRTIFRSYHLWVLFVPLIALCFQRPSARWLFIPTYFLCSLLLGVYASRGVGVDINAWFDLFMAAAIVFGVFTAERHDAQIVRNPSYKPGPGFNPHTPRSAVWIGWQNPVVTYGILALCLLPFLHNFKAKLIPVLEYEGLSQREVAYKKEVLLLRSISGPVLYQERLLGFDAGKEFLVDISKAAQMIVSGRIPEELMIAPIRSKYFSAVILSFDVEKQLADPGKLISKQQWTPATLTAIRENYQLFAPEGPQQHFFYLPR